MVWEFKVFVLDFFLFGGFAFSVYSLAICLWFHYFCFGGGTSVFNLVIHKCFLSGCFKIIWI